MSVKNGTVDKCRIYYQDVYVGALAKGNTPATALDECFHHFLDQRPVSASGEVRAQGIAAATFWGETDVVTHASLSALVLSRVLYFDDGLSINQANVFAETIPDVFRQAIRYAKVFTKPHSQLWISLQENQHDKEWKIFFAVCYRLMEQLGPYQKTINEMERQLAQLSIIEFLSYLSVSAYHELAEGDARNDRLWNAYQRVISNKLSKCNGGDFNLDEARLGASLKRHLSPMLFPSSAPVTECLQNMTAIRSLLSAMQELIDYEASIDWFCFDHECRYQFKPDQPVIYHESDAHTLSWYHTDQKQTALWIYWLNRGVDAFIHSGKAGTIIGRPENHEMNQFAYIKALGHELRLREVYGLTQTVQSSNGVRADLFRLLLASELTTAFFQREYIDEFQKIYSQCGTVIGALGRLAFNGILSGQNRFPMTWSEEKTKIESIIGWTVSEQLPTGSHEVAKAILDFWTNDLSKLAENIKQQRHLPVPRLYELPYYKIGRYRFQFPWVVGQQNNLTATVNNLRRIGARRLGQNDETKRVEIELANQLRQRNFNVVSGFQPARTVLEDPGEIDIVCHRDGVLLLLEVKSGYIRSTRHEIWLHRTNTLRKAACQLRRKKTALYEALQTDTALCNQLGIACTTDLSFHCWIVDTSIEFDQQIVDGFLVASLESLVVTLRDEVHLLFPLDERNDYPMSSLFPSGFTAREWVQCVENGSVWKNIGKLDQLQI